jgi:hypothetical protein
LPSDSILRGLIHYRSDQTETEAAEREVDEVGEDADADTSRWSGSSPRSTLARRPRDAAHLGDDAAEKSLLRARVRPRA